jgi:subtilisin family serine protease
VNRERTLRQSVITRTLAAACVAVLGLAFAGTASAQRYVVLYKHVAPPGLAEVQVNRAGGSVVATYHRIGVVVAESSDAGFESSIERFRQVDGAAATAGYAVPAGMEWRGGPFGGLPNEPATDEDTFSGLQWGLDQIHAKEAHEVTGGSPKVLVGHIDTGVDGAHPDLAPNLDVARSVSCVGGAPNADPEAWKDDSGHGTHTAGIIAAASNDTGVVGVAPNVRVAAIKASVRQGTSDFFLPEAVVCSFMWAAEHDVDVANNSYSTDATLMSGQTLFCEDDPDQSVIIDAVGRAVEWATHRGVTVVASAGNGSPPVDVTADECLRLPSELPGVVTVAGTAPDRTKSSISNFGLGYVDVAAPAGEGPPGFPPPSGFQLSTWPSYIQVPNLLCDPLASPCPPPDGTPRSYYRFMAGTSQAAAHVSGVAALIVSRYGTKFRLPWGKLHPRLVELILEKTADHEPCPADERCQSRRHTNGFFGHGIVNALEAVTVFEDLELGMHDDRDEGDRGGRKDRGRDRG